VYKAIFSICYTRYRLCLSKYSFWPLIIDGLARSKGKGGRGLPNVEYCVDFELTARRALSPFEYAIFKHHYIDGLDAPGVCRTMGISEPVYNGRITMLRVNLGQRYALLKPFPLLPDIYFNADRHTHDVRPLPIPAQRYANGVPLVPPLAQKSKAGPEPEPVVIPIIPLAQAPENTAPFPIDDPEARDKYIRHAFTKEHLSLFTIVLRLNRWQVPCPFGDRFTVSHVKKIILNYGGLVRHQQHMPKAA
jgi:hypothetical protein